MYTCASRYAARARGAMPMSPMDLVAGHAGASLRSERLFLGGDWRSWLTPFCFQPNKNRRRSWRGGRNFMPCSTTIRCQRTEAEPRYRPALATLVEEQRAVCRLRGGGGGGGWGVRWWGGVVFFGALFWGIGGGGGGFFSGGGW